MLAYFFPPPIPTIERKNDAAGTVHDAWIRLAWRQNWRQRLVFAAMIVIWPIYVAAAALFDVAVLGERVEQEFGKSRSRQFAEQVSIAMHHGLAPRHYYMFELYRDGMAARASEFLNRTETKAFIYGRFVDESKWVDGKFPFANKVQFHDLCVLHKLPTVPILALGHKGRMIPIGADDVVPPKDDLFLKPRGLRGGLGAQIWRYSHGRYHRYGTQQEEWLGFGPWLRQMCVQPQWRGFGLLIRRSLRELRSRWRGGDRSLDAAGLERHVARLSLQYCYLVQPRMRPHRDLADLSMGVLTTVRVLTSETPDGHVVASHAVLRMPLVRDAVVDNFHAGGIAAPIDMKTGRLGKATDMGLRRDSAWHATHPINGAQIEGRVLPHWPAVLDLACKAQRAFSDRPFVGWDIAILDSGPCLVEGNGRPDIELIQRPYREPLGNSPFGEILAQHVERKFGFGRRSAPPSRQPSGTTDPVDESDGKVTAD